MGLVAPVCGCRSDQQRNGWCHASRSVRRSHRTAHAARSRPVRQRCSTCVALPYQARNGERYGTQGPRQARSETSSRRHPAGDIQPATSSRPYPSIPASRRYAPVSRSPRIRQPTSREVLPRGPLAPRAPVQHVQVDAAAAARSPPRARPLRCRRPRHQPSPARASVRRPNPPRSPPRLLPPIACASESHACIHLHAGVLQPSRPRIRARLP
jgi:hypothetical protein